MVASAVRGPVLRAPSTTVAGLAAHLTPADGDVEDLGALADVTVSYALDEPACSAVENLRLGVEVAAVAVATRGG
jgi:hypothetical protein